MTDTPPQPIPTLPEIPPELLKAAQDLCEWMQAQGHQRWELLGLCSRNYADEARLYHAQTKANEWQAEVIKLAESIITKTEHEQEYLLAKWSINP